MPGPRPPRQYPSRAAEIRARREHLRSSLAGNLGLLPEHVTFVQEHPEEAAWVKARVPPETWTRLDDPSEIGGEEVGNYIWVAEPPDEGEGHEAFLGYH